MSSFFQSMEKGSVGNSMTGNFQFNTNRIDLPLIVPNMDQPYSNRDFFGVNMDLDSYLNSLKQADAWMIKDISNKVLFSSGAEEIFLTEIKQIMNENPKLYEALAEDKFD